MDSSSSDEEEEGRGGRSFVQVVSEKYDSENFPYCHGMGMVLMPSPPSSPVKDRLNLPSTLVLEHCGITKAGDRTEVAAFCSHVVELDLSHNQLRDWEEIGIIVSNVPHLDFLNLSMNPLSGVQLEPSLAEVFSRVRRLVLTNTHVTWDTVNTLTSHTPELEELFLCLNLYQEVVDSERPCPSLRLLQITDNQLRAWTEVRKLGAMYPRLEMLVLANNSLDSVEDSSDALEQLFPNLRSLNLSHSGLSTWEDVERLNFFPKLEEVKIKGIPLLQQYSKHQRLPAVSMLNGSLVTEGDREDAERFFIRHFQDLPEEELPRRHSISDENDEFSPRSPEVAESFLTAGRGRYHVLVSKYGKLLPLAEVDMTPHGPTVDVRCGDTVEVVSLRPGEKVGQLKKRLQALVRLTPGGMRLFHIGRASNCSVAVSEEMKYPSRALHSYGIRDGDEILVVPKVKARCRSTDI
ncbi:hypothetical protein NHX12_010184 [Muraenolepis orangiensis]|uniref:Tubulin-specific chaperone cofactor E-like protein n=1 Tax=Muraenolepis orangiensis TaxID=630683 RepID=A0A9Q0DHR7_9TELE|nr:hypothetical protein NHX12_010184 [Muraenolepis orangiensis]